MWVPVGGSEPTVNTTGGGRGGCHPWVVVNHPQSTLLVEVGVGASGW